MYKHKNKVSSPNFLDTKKSTYSKRRKTNSQRIQTSLATVTTALIITIITVGFVDHVKVSANENTGGVYKEQNTRLAYEDTETDNGEVNNTEINTQQNNQQYSDNTRTVYVKEVNISPQFKYDSNSVKMVDNHLMCVKDDNILQWQKGRNRWECHKATKTVFGDTEGLDIASDGTVKCRNTGEILYWDDEKDNWNCTSVGATVYISELLGVDISQNPQTNSLLTYNGLEWTDESISDVLGREIVQNLTSVNAQLTNLLGVTSIDTTTEQTIYNALNDDFFAQGGNTFGANALLGTNDNYALLLRTNGAERVRISEDGNVGIGTSSPTHKLDVAVLSGEGGIIARGVAGSNNILQANAGAGFTNAVARLYGEDTTDTYSILDIRNSNNEGLIVRGNGYVGVGTTGPIHRLDVDGNIRATSTFYANGGINFRETASTINDGNLLINYSDADRLANFRSTALPGSASGMTFSTTGSSDMGYQERMRIAGDGNIGIGTMTPTEHLTLEGGNFLQTAVGDPTTKGNWDPNDTNVMDSPYSVQVSGKYAYVIGRTSNNLAIVDISDSSNPTTVGIWDANIMSGVHEVRISGKYAYVTGYYSDNLVIVDISDPSNPTTVGNWDPNDNNIMNETQSVQISGKYAYVAGWSSDNLVIVDISDPSNPTTVGNWDPNDANVMDGARSVQISGKYAYVTGGNSDNLAIIDISDSSNPTTIGNWDPNDANVMDSAHSVQISGKYAYVTGGNSDNLAIIDISDPSNPTTVGSWDPNNTSIMDYAHSLSISGKYAYVVGWSSDNLVIVDISDPTNSTTVGNWDPNDANVMDGARSVQISGKYAYVAGYYSDNLVIVDIAGIDAPSANIGSLATETLDVWGSADINNNLNVGTGLNVGGNALINGELSVSGNASINGDLFTGNILPHTTNTYTLGSTSNRFQDLYLGPNSLHIGTSISDEGIISYDTGSNIFNFGTASAIGNMAFNTNQLFLDKLSGNIGVGLINPDAQFTIANIDTNKDSLAIYQDIQTSTFAGEYGDSVGGDEFRAVVQSVDGGYVAVGLIYVTGRSADIYVAKFANNGDLDESFGVDGMMTIGTTAYDVGNDIIATKDGGYMIVGQTNDGGDGDVYIVKITEDGIIDNSFGVGGELRFGGADYEHIVSVIQLSDRSYLLAGATRSYGSGDWDLYAIKITEDGSIDAAFGTNGYVTVGGGGSDRMVSVIEANDGGFVLVGNTSSYDLGQGDMYAVKLTKDGVLDTNFGTNGTVVIGTTHTESANDAVKAMDGGYVIVGYSWDSSTSYDMYAVKLTEDGTLDTNFGTNGSIVVAGGATDEMESIITTKDGGYMIAGNTMSYGAGGRDAYFVKLMENGDLDTSFGNNGTRTVGDASYEYIYSVIESRDGAYVAVGRTGPEYNAFIIKIDSDGDFGGSCGSLQTGSGSSIRTLTTTIGSGGVVGSGGSSIAAVTTTDAATVTTSAQYCSLNSVNTNQTVFNVNNYGQVGIGANANLGYRLNVNGAAVSNGWFTSSDKRFKTNIKTVQSSLDKITQLDGVSYNYKTEEFEDRGFDDKKHLGLLAQDVEKVFPELVYTDSTGYKAVDYTGLISPMINSIKEQNLTISSNKLKTDTSITNLSQLQTSVDIQFASVSEMFDDVDEGMLEIETKANNNADLIEAVTLRIDEVQGGLDVLELLGATDALKLEELLAIDAEKLIFTDEEGDLTLEGVLNVNTIIAESIETVKLKAANVQLTRDGDAAIAGQGDFESNQLIAEIETTAVTKDSLVFVTPYDTLAKSLSVSEIVCDENNENCTGFTVSREDATEEIMFFNWFIVDEDDSEDVE